MHAGFKNAQPLSFQLVNELRASLGRVDLARDPAVDAAARNWSHVMEAEDDMHHRSLGWAENIAWWGADWKPPHEAAIRFDQLWINSSGYYGNITDANWRKVVIGFWVGDNGWYATRFLSR